MSIKAARVQAILFRGNDRPSATTLDDLNKSVLVIPLVGQDGLEGETLDQRFSLTIFRGLSRR
jgi:hypothetical protein